MRYIVIFVSLFVSSFVRGATINVSPSESVDWNIVQPGDVIQLAAGNYSGGFAVKKSGTSSNPITIKGPSSGSATWKSSWDIGTSNYITIDGQSDNPYGIRIDLSGGSGGDGMRWGDKANVTNLTIKYVELIGTPKTTGVTQGSYGLNFAPYDFKRSNLLVNHCRLFQWCETFRSNNWEHAIIEFCEIRKTQTDNVDHADIIYNYPCVDVTWRYNSIWESPVDGMFFEYGGGKDFKFYGNWYWSSQNHLIFFKAPGTYGPITITNNVFHCPKSGNQYAYISMNGSTLASGSKIQNNVFYNTTNDVGGDHNGYYPETTNGYGYPKGNGNFLFSGDGVFVDSSKGNFRLTSAGKADLGGKGVSLPAPYNKDADGNTFDPDSWDVGAFVADGGSGPSPTPSVSPSPSATPTPKPTATPNPSPSPSTKFKIGDWITPTAEVNVRRTAAGTVLGTHAIGDVGKVTSGPSSAPLNGTNVNWWVIDWQTDPDGYTGEDDLAKASNPTPTPSPTATPNPSPSPNTPTYEKWILDLNNWIRSNPPYTDPNN